VAGFKPHPAPRPGRAQRLREAHVFVPRGETNLAASQTSVPRRRLASGFLHLCPISRTLLGPLDLPETRSQLPRAMDLHV